MMLSKEALEPMRQATTNFGEDESGTGMADYGVLLDHKTPAVSQHSCQSCGMG